MSASISRRDWLASAGPGLLALGGCRKTVQTASLNCPISNPTPITKKLLFDRTTVLPISQVGMLVGQVSRRLQSADVLQVVRFGGITPSLVEEAARFQLPAYVDTPQQREIDRWSKAPAEIERERGCAAKQREALDLEARLAAVLHDVDSSPQGRSPNFEALHAALHQWREVGHRDLYLVCDGVEHVSPDRTFYGRVGGLSLPDPKQWVKQLQAEMLMPDLRGVRVFHLAIGLSEPAAKAKARGLRPYGEIRALRRLWSSYWEASGARFSFGEPLFIDGLIPPL